MKYLKFNLLFCLTFLLFSCTPKEDNQTASDPDFNNVKVAVNIQRLDKEMFACQTKDDLLEFFDKYPTFINDYFQVSSADFDKLAEQLLPLIQNQGLRDFYKQSQEPAFFGGQTLENEFRTAFQHIKYYYPNFKEPKIYTIFSGFFNQFNLKDPELMVSDSVIYIGLDYFMGKKGKYLPEVYDYQLRKAMPEALVPQTVLLLSQRFNATNPKDKSLLTDMVWYGKSYVFGHTMMPEKADSLFIGYTSDQLSGSYENQESIWAHFIDNQLLYNNQDPVKAKYVGERPTTPEIGKSCPGSIGRWLGWRIVGKYFDENEKLTIQDLMKMNDAQKIFEASKYKGLADEE
jgi:gliding motility-associated lipoprotein GldB